MTTNEITNLIAHAIREADGWECDPEINLTTWEHPRARCWTIAAEMVLAKLAQAGLFIKPDGKEWEDVVHDLNQENEDLQRQVNELNRKYADSVDKVDVAGKMGDDIVALAKELVKFAGR